MVNAFRILNIIIEALNCIFAVAWIPLAMIIGTTETYVGMDAAIIYFTIGLCISILHLIYNLILGIVEIVKYKQAPWIVCSAVFLSIDLGSIVFMYIMYSIMNFIVNF